VEEALLASAEEDQAVERWEHDMAGCWWIRGDGDQHRRRRRRRGEWREGGEAGGREGNGFGWIGFGWRLSTGGVFKPG
jgi:hypothetical protein